RRPNLRARMTTAVRPTSPPTSRSSSVVSVSPNGEWVKFTDGGPVRPGLDHRGCRWLGEGAGVCGGHRTPYCPATQPVVWRGAGTRTPPLVFSTDTTPPIH